jgi:hypothetical protein
VSVRNRQSKPFAPPKRGHQGLKSHLTLHTNPPRHRSCHHTPVLESLCEAPPRPSSLPVRQLAAGRLPPSWAWSSPHSQASQRTRSLLALAPLLFVTRVPGRGGEDRTESREARNRLKSTPHTHTPAAPLPGAPSCASPSLPQGKREEGSVLSQNREAHELKGLPGRTRFSQKSTHLGANSRHADVKPE